MSNVAISSQSLAKEQLLQLYSKMVTIRLFEEKVQELYRKTMIPGIAHLSIGQEAVPVGVCTALQPEDYITSTHRGHGHCLAKGADIDRMFAELFGKVTGYCRGKGGSMHIANQDIGNLGANAIVGGSIPIATGAAFSAKIRRTNQVAVCFFGDGALNQGVLLESMNLAAIWQLPVIFVCESNQYGEYTPMKLVTAGDAQARGEALSIPSATLDGMDVIAVYHAATKAVEHARTGNGPTFLVFETYRYCGHGMSDVDRRYRSREEEQKWKAFDPIERLGRLLISENHAPQFELDRMKASLEETIDASIETAWNAPFPEPEEVAKHVYAD